MAISDELVNCFAAANFQTNNQIIDKCIELCLTYNLTAEEFVDQFFAYTVSHLNGAPPTLENLDQLERKELQKYGKSRPKSPKFETTTTPKTPVRTKQITTLTTPTTGGNDENTPSQRYSKRLDSRSIQSKFGEFKYEQHQHSRDVNVKVQEMVGSVRYMYEKFGTRATILNNLTQEISEEICKIQQLELTPHPLREYTGEVVVCGRIYSDSDKLNQHSAILEGTLKINKGAIIKLELKNVERMALFNGQIVVIEGNNTKNSLIVKKIHTGAITPIENHSHILDEPIRIMVACGPFTLPDNLLYEPLKDLISCVIDNKPNVLILIGPFLEKTHDLLETITESFDEFVNNLIESLIENIPETIRIVLIPSNRDVHNHIIYPTPPYRLVTTKSNVILSPDPAFIDIDGVRIAITSIDILFELNKHEYFSDRQQNQPNDRMSRLVRHILQQKCFYPIHSNNSNIRIDYQLLENYGVLDTIPHILILPSTFKNFIKNINGCITINPERLIKGNVAGTFTKIEIQPGDGPISERIACQVLRV